MIGITLKHLKNKFILTIVDNNDNIIRKVDLIEGNKYIVNPINKNKYKHRGRKIILQGIERDTYGAVAKVKFLDTKRVGKVEIDDLDNLN